MVERVILIVAAVMVGLLFIFALMSAPPKDGSNNIDTGINVADYDFNPPEDSWFQGNVIEREGVVVVDFKADWCGPCKMLHPHLEKLESKYQDRLSLVQIDVDEKSQLARHYKVEAMPTVLLFSNGQVVSGFVGYRDFAQIETIFKPQIEQVEPSEQSASEGVTIRHGEGRSHPATVANLK